MKKFFFGIVMFLLLISACFAKTIDLTSLNYSFVVPDGYSTDSTYIASRYQYFAAHHPQDRIVMTVTSSPYTGKSFDLLSTLEVQKLKNAYVSQYKAYGINLVSMEKYISNGITYLKMEVKLPAGYQIQYATIKNKKMNGFTFTSKSSFSTAEKNEVEAIVKSIKNT